MLTAYVSRVYGGVDVLANNAGMVLDRKSSRAPEQGADTAVWLVTLPDDGPSGQFFRDRQPID